MSSFTTKALFSVLILVSCVISFSQAANTDVDLHGSGASFPAPLYFEWQSSYSLLRPGPATLSYNAIGSGGGKGELIAKENDFAGSDSPPKDSELEAAAEAGVVMQFQPFVAGAVVAFANLGDSDLEAQLVMDRPTLAKIFSGEISRWDDPAIRATNPGLALPSEDIIVVVRLDKSGTTNIYQNALVSFDPDWPWEADSVWNEENQAALAGRLFMEDGSFRVTGRVATTPYSIGYGNLAFPVQAGFSYIRMINRLGETVDAVEGLDRALSGEIVFDEKFTADIVDLEIPGAWPIAGLTYLVVDANNTNVDPIRCEKLATLLRWAEFCLFQESFRNRALVESYAPLAPNLAQRVYDNLLTLECNGEPIQLFKVSDTPDYVSVVTILFGVICIVSAIVMTIFLVLWWSNEWIMFGDRDFLLMLPFGVLVAGIGLVVLGSTYDGVPEDEYCSAAAWLICLSVAILYLSLLIKSLRMYLILAPSKKMQTSVKIDAVKMIFIMFILWIPFVVMMTVWQTSDNPFEAIPTAVDENDEVNVLCNAEEPWYAVAILVYSGILICFAVYVSMLNRTLGHGFSETKSLALSIYNSILVIGVCSLIVWVLDKPYVEVVVVAVGVSALALVPLFAVLLPRFSAIIKGKTFRMVKPGRSTCHRCGVPCQNCGGSSGSGSGASGGARSSTPSSDN